MNKEQKELKRVEKEALKKLKTTLYGLNLDSAIVATINFQVNAYCKAYAELECSLRA